MGLNGRYCDLFKYLCSIVDSEIQAHLEVEDKNSDITKSPTNTPIYIPVPNNVPINILPPTNVPINIPAPNSSSPRT